MGSAIGSVTDVVIGRRLWEEWSQFWPTMGDADPFASFINAVPKHVVLDHARRRPDVEQHPHRRATRSRHVRDLAAGEGGDISVVGGDRDRALALPRRCRRRADA